MRHQSETVCQLAQENIAAAQGKQERLYNKKAAARSYQPRDWGSVIIANSAQKIAVGVARALQGTWWEGSHTYKVLVKGKTKVFHANLLKRYVNHEEPIVVATVAQSEG